MQGLAINSTLVRDNFSQTFDTVIRRKPQIVKRHRDALMMVSLDHLAAALEFFSFTGTVTRDEAGSFILSNNEIDDIFGYGDTFEEAMESLANELIEYSVEYINEQFEKYFNSPNRKRHLPYVFKVLLQNSVADVVRLIRVEHERS